MTTSLRGRSTVLTSASLPFDHVEVVQLTDEDQFAEDLKTDTVARLGEGLMQLVEEPVNVNT